MATYHIPNQKKSLLPCILCSVVFCCFTFIYLFSYQCDVLAVTQHVLSDGQTYYDKTIGAILITVVLYLLHISIFWFFRLSRIGYALTFFPSLLLLTALTDIDTEKIYHHSALGAWWCVIPLLLLLCFFALRYLKQKVSYKVTQASYNVLSRPMWINLLSLVVMFCMVCTFSNHDKFYHYRAKMEVAIHEHRFEDALKVGENSLYTDSSLVMLRAYALSKVKRLGEDLFEYPLQGGSEALLPNGESVKMLMLPTNEIQHYLGKSMKSSMKVVPYLEFLERHHLGKSVIGDYLLCAYLLDKRLDDFVKLLPKYYEINASLPKHYREALILYTHLRSQPSVTYTNNVMDADYEDYQTIAKKYPNTLVRKTNVRDIYGKTYWYYYQYSGV
ncbi:DUF6057 family protein [Hoylesella timonensis]|uniref:DUF6057 family protein n=1 Tax=Hoylesella timonensis TaxID=386414 RepID=UPI000423D66A|nr:DUF6057 family protein [Hoylesella timonensis]